MSVENEVYYNELFSEYGPLLTDKQREIFDMYFRLDLSFGEIAEIKSVSRQSVADTVSKVKRQLDEYESRLSLYKKRTAVYRLIDGLSEHDKEIGERIVKIITE